MEKNRQIRIINSIGSESEVTPSQYKALFEAVDTEVTPSQYKELFGEEYVPTNLKPNKMSNSLSSSNKVVQNLKFSNDDTEILRDDKATTPNFSITNLVKQKDKEMGEGIYFTSTQKSLHNSKIFQNFSDSAGNKYVDSDSELYSDPDSVDPYNTTIIDNKNSSIKNSDKKINVSNSNSDSGSDSA